MRPGPGFAARSREPDSSDSVSTQIPELMERTRIVVAGVLAPSVLHEFANLLTIVDGSRQVARLGLKPPDFTTMDPTADRCGELVVAFRHLLSTPRDVGTRLLLRTELCQIEPLVAARLRGVATRFTTDGVDPAVSLIDRVLTPLRIAWFALILGEIERVEALGKVPVEITLAAERLPDRGIALSASFRTSESPRRSEEGSSVAFDELAMAGEALLEHLGVDLRWVEGEGRGPLARVAHLSIPCPVADRE